MKSIAHYKIIGRLGAGGMGEVYRGLDTRLGREVAIKTLPAAASRDPDLLQRFEREAQVLAALNHPHIALIYGFEETESTSALVLELVEGETLMRRLADGPLDVPEALRVAAQIASALVAAHEKGIVHRDLKPANIMLTPQGTAKVLDFGLAKLEPAFQCTLGPTGRTAAVARAGSDAAPTAGDSTECSVPQALTRSGMILGSVPYMSPEQAEGRSVDARSDVFSFGAVLYEMLTGRPAFGGTSPAAIVSSILRDHPAPVSGIIPGVSVELDELVRRCLHKDPTERLQNMRVVAAGLASGSARTRQPPAPSVAVLPFVNLSADPENEYFSDGIAEDLILALSRIRGLRVPARTSSFAFKGKNEDVRRIGQILSVDHVVEGSVRRSGSRVRITAQLVQVTNGFQLWAERFDREMQDVFAIQDEVSRTIAETLEVRLTAGHREAARRAPNAEAYQSCLKGRYCWNQRTFESLQRAIEHFETAIRLDPLYAAAYAGAADCYNLAYYYRVLPAGQAFPKARKAALRALELDPNLAQAHSALGFHELFFHWDAARAEERFRRAIRLNENYPTAHQWLGMCLMTVERWDQAQDEWDRAHALDPLSLSILASAGWLHYFRGDFEQAMERFREALELNPTFPFALHWLGMSLSLSGRTTEAIPVAQAACEHAADNPVQLAAFGFVLARAGRSAEARRLIARLQEMEQHRYVASYDYAVIHAGLGEASAALQSLERALEDRFPFLIWLKFDPAFNFLRHDPRFHALLKRVALPLSAAT